MIATREYVNECFNRFNGLCFKGELPDIPIYIGHAKRCLGKFHYYIKRPLFGKPTYYDFSIRISDAVDLPENELEDVIIHEMIHYFIIFKNLKDSSPHGHIFRQMMNSINENFGRNIQISHKSTALNSERKTLQNKFYVICVTTLKNGEKGVTVCAKTRILMIRRLIPKCYNVERMDFFVSNDSFFEKFPRSNTPRIYKISEDDLRIHLCNATPVR